VVDRDCGIGGKYGFWARGVPKDLEMVSGIALGGQNAEKSCVYG
jgi:hypothetical protein